MGNCCEPEPVPASPVNGAAVISAAPAKPEADGSEVSESNDDDVEDLPPPEAYVNRGPRTSVSAEAYGAWNKTKAYSPPVYPKTPDQRERIQAAVARNFMFSALDQGDLHKVIDAMQEKSIGADATVIEQGAEVGENDHGLYILESGTLLVFKRKTGEQGRGAQVHQYTTAGDGFGELALLYNCPRAATVASSTPCKLWALDRAAFNGLVKDACIRKRMQYQDFLAKVKIFQSLESYEIAKLSDVLRTHTMKKGDVVIKEGDQGDTFYLLMDGECEATVSGKVVMEYRNKGDYFGELALKSGSDGVRKASVTCTTDGQCATMDRHSFKRLLGNLESILGARQDEYNAALKS